MSSALVLSLYGFTSPSAIPPCSAVRFGVVADHVYEKREELPDHYHVASRHPLDEEPEDLSASRIAEGGRVLSHGAARTPSACRPDFFTADEVEQSLPDPVLVACEALPVHVDHRDHSLLRRAVAQRPFEGLLEIWEVQGEIFGDLPERPLVGA